LSTLTKVLIVLLTVFSIFLCGIVVTYVANAENYRKTADGQRSQVQSMRNERDAAVRSEEEQKQAAEQLKAELNKQITELQTAKTELLGEIDKVKRENAQLVQDIAKMNATVKMANETAAKLTEQSKAAETEVATLRASQTKQTKQLNETTQTLLEKMAIIAQLEEKNRQLLESKQEIEGQLNRMLQQSGRVAAQPQPVTPTRAIAQPAAARVSKEIGLNGRVMAVDAKNRLAQISIGAAAGVQQDMKFHVTRGEQFVCDILILEVFPDKAVGILDLVELQPQIGDSVTTNL
jgi:chromosome segregation ATPase